MVHGKQKGEISLIESGVRDGRQKLGQANEGKNSELEESSAKLTDAKERSNVEF